MPHVLVVDDEPDVRGTLARLVSRHGHVVTQAASAPEGIDGIWRLHPDLVITDMEMGPEGSGFDVLEAGKKANIPVVFITAHKFLKDDLLKRGAANFLPKPFEMDQIREVLRGAFGPDGAGAARPLRKEKAQAPGEVAPIGKDEAFRAVLALVDKIADTDARILVTGESGTGKEVIARAIHQASKRRDKPFVAVNCGAIPDQLLESELFGHVKGAFTGATHERAGRFKMAEGGTLFLDEIGDMPMMLQVKLLRVIQEKEYEVLGDSRPRPSNVRIIAATHRNLEKLVAEGKFRDDLFFRLNVVPLHLPPLRERPVDVPLLVDFYIEQVNASYGRGVTGITPSALELLRAYPWPGNVRELANVIERMVVIRGSGMLDDKDVPANLRAPKGGWSAAGATQGPPASGGARFALPSAGIDLGEALQNIEGTLIQQALERTHDNKTQAAKLLGINRTTLVEKLKRREDQAGAPPGGSGSGTGDDEG